ncbi:MAG TPA: HD domain-containing phosphohydrolase [Pyrinomonadaceae bacterium]|nr:HD domain-containing phosphohydrolase [Pyrinomonadaceae bacterium]
MIRAREERACILIADDEEEIRNVLYELLAEDYECRLVASAEEALALLRTMRFDVVVSDIQMEGMSGLEMIPHVAKIAPDATVVMVSGAQTVESAIEALRAGAFDYVTKPFDLRHVEAAVSRALEHTRLREAKRRYENYLEELVAERTTELNRTLESLEDSYRMTLKALAAALETRDRETHGHSERVVSFSLRLGRELNLRGEELRSLEFGALLHDIGKIGVPDAILHKPAQLCEEEWVNMRRHPLHGQQILQGINFLEGAARVVGQHHEKWDGTGYPQGLRGKEIDLNARIFAVADAFDAITSDRVYRAGRSYEVAVGELEEFAGRQFDPEVVAAFHRIPRAEWDELREVSLRKWQERRRCGEAAKLNSSAEIETLLGALVN